jgi:ribosomal protein L24
LLETIKVQGKVLRVDREKQSIVEGVNMVSIQKPSAKALKVVL